jgi:hypothetical protein
MTVSYLWVSTDFTAFNPSQTRAEIIKNIGKQPKLVKPGLEWFLTRFRPEDPYGF